jgi:Uma2 family endonuclease
MTPSIELDPARTKLIYEWDAERYLKSLPLEHFMEATAQATQRQITVESFALIRALRPDVQVFNELLVQYPRDGEDPDKPARVVPDNMVVVHTERIDAAGSFMTPLQPVGPFLVLEYVSKATARKDYDDNYRRYEQELKVPYYLLFYPDNEELSVFRLTNGRYISVKPNAAGRLAIPELELEVALLDGWARFWFRGELLPLPGDLLLSLRETKSQLAAAEQKLTTTEQKLATTENRFAEAERARLAAEAELIKLREELARSKTG